MSAPSETRESGAYFAMIGLSLLFTILMIITLIPNPGASKPNILGYRSVCTFAPSASALCGLLAGITCTIRARMVSKRKATLRYRPPLVPALVGIILIGIAVVSGVIFAGVQSSFSKVIRSTEERAAGTVAFTDGTRTATAEDGAVSATVEVTVNSGRIEAIRLTGGENMDAGVVKTMTDEVLSAQSTEVEAVTGATASSLLFLEAVRNAAGGR